MKSPLKLCVGFLNEAKYEEKNINAQIFGENFDYQSLWIFVKDLFEDNQNKNDIITEYVNEQLIDLESSISSKEIPENESPEKWSILLKK